MINIYGAGLNASIRGMTAAFREHGSQLPESQRGEVDQGIARSGGREILAQAIETMSGEDRLGTLDALSYIPSVIETLKVILENFFPLIPNLKRYLEKVDRFLDLIKKLLPPNVFDGNKESQVIHGPITIPRNVIVDRGLGKKAWKAEPIDPRVVKVTLVGDNDLVNIEGLSPGTMTIIVTYDDNTTEAIPVTVR